MSRSAIATFAASDDARAPGAARRCSASRWSPRCSRRCSIGGWNLSFGALAPDFSRLSPHEGLRPHVLDARPRRAGEGVRQIRAGRAVRRAVPVDRRPTSCSRSAREPTAAAIGHAVTLSGQALLVLAGALALIAAIDVPWQLLQHIKQLKMTRQEIREEMKESEGSPGDQGPHPPAAARDRAPPHDAGSAEGGRGRHQPDALRRGAALRRQAHARADRGRQGRGRSRRAHPRSRRASTSCPIFEAPPLARALYPQRRHRTPKCRPASTSPWRRCSLTSTSCARRSAAGDVPPAPPTIDPVDVERRRSTNAWLKPPPSPVLLCACC